jgi:hypothetical protein
MFLNCRIKWVSGVLDVTEKFLAKYAPEEGECDESNEVLSNMMNPY